MISAPLLPPFFTLRHLEAIDSTNEEAKRLAATGAAEGTLVWADRQSEGRGRRDRTWVSPPGNLYLSLLLRPGGSAAAAAQLGFAAALATAEACASVLPTDRRVQCKWPNDVLVDGRKIAGILLESRSGLAAAIDWLIVGIGVNCASHPEGTEYPAASLAACGAAIVPAALLSGVAERFLAWYDAWRHPGGFERLRAAWLDRAANLGDAIRVRLPAAELEGRFAGLDAQGRLLLDGPQGRVPIAAAEIFPAA